MSYIQPPKVTLNMVTLKNRSIRGKNAETLPHTAYNNENKDNLHITLLIKHIANCHH